jgi:hypothetical protein
MASAILAFVGGAVTVRGVFLLHQAFPRVRLGVVMQICGLAMVIGAMAMAEG